MRSAEILLASQGGTTAVLRRCTDMPEVAASLAASKQTYEKVLSTARFSNREEFFARLRNVYVSSRANLVGFIMSFVCGLAVAVFLACNGHSDYVGVGLVSVCAAFPSSLISLHTWAYLRLQSQLYHKRMVGAGEHIVHELADADVLCYTDIDAFPTSESRIRKIKVCGEKRLDKLFEHLSALFATLGGPLNGLFSVSGDYVRLDVPVEIKQITEEGISAVVNDERILVGRGSYMQQHGITFYYDAEDEQQLRNPDTPIMFVACEGLGAAKLYLSYGMNEQFEAYIQHLSKLGVGVVLRTADPNVTYRMIDRVSCLEQGSVGIVRSKITVAEEAKTKSNGLVGYNVTPKELYASKFLFASYRRMQQLLPILSSAMIPFCSILCGLAATARVGSLGWLAVMCQFLTLTPTLLIIESVLRKFQLGDTSNEQ